MPQCQFPVFCCFWFQKSTSANILGIARNKRPRPYFSSAVTESEGETKEGAEVAKPQAGAAGGPPRRLVVWAPRGPPASPRRLYIASDAKTLKYQAYFQKSSAAPPPSTTSFGGQKSLFRHAAGTGNCPRSHLHRLHRHLHRRC